MSNIGLSEDKKQVFENELLTGFQFKRLTENKIFQKMLWLYVHVILK